MSTLPISRVGSSFPLYILWMTLSKFSALSSVLNPDSSQVEWVNCGKSGNEEGFCIPILPFPPVQVKSWLSREKLLRRNAFAIM